MDSSEATLSKTKQCNKCGQTLPISEFYKQSGMRDGTFSKCKTCTKRDVRENRLARYEQYREYEKSRAMAPHRVDLRARYAATERGKERIRAGVKAWIERNPLKKSATTAVNNAVRDGRLQKQACEICGKAKAQGHHDDYSKPLEVRWLCTTHHREWHKHNTPVCPDQRQINKG